MVQAFHRRVGAVIFGIIWIVALLGLARRPARRAVLPPGRQRWSLSAWLLRILADWWSQYLRRAPRWPWVGSYLLLGFAALIVSGGMGLDGFSADVKERSFSWLQPATVVAGIAVCLIMLAAQCGGCWLARTAPSSVPGSTRFRRTS